MLHARNPREPLRKLLDDDAPLVLRVVSGLFGQVDVRREQAAGVPARVALEQGVEPPDHHRGGAEKGERHGDLAHNQCMSHEQGGPAG